MSILRIQERTPLQPVTVSYQESAFIQLTETLCTIITSWEVLVAETWSAAALQAFAGIARQNALELSTLGCGALERAMVELVLALDALILSGSISPQQVERVDFAMAQMRAVTVQRLLTRDLPQLAEPGDAPILFIETCPRCGNTASCPMMRAN